MRKISHKTHDSTYQSSSYISKRMIVLKVLLLWRGADHEQGAMIRIRYMNANFEPPIFEWCICWNILAAEACHIHVVNSDDVVLTSGLSNSITSVISVYYNCVAHLLLCSDCMLCSTASIIKEIMNVLMIKWRLRNDLWGWQMIGFKANLCFLFLLQVYFFKVVNWETGIIG